jgi:peptide chain release factor 1
VTVAVLGGTTAADTPWNKRSKDDFKIEWYNGTIGAGGQNHQKTQNCARVRHIPTGTVRTAQTRSRKNSLQNAMEAMEAELDRLGAASSHAAHNSVRKASVGTGERSDKRRTWRFQEDRVHDHETGKSAVASRLLKGEFRLIW